MIPIDLAVDEESLGTSTGIGPDLIQLMELLERARQDECRRWISIRIYDVLDPVLSTIDRLEQRNLQTQLHRCKSLEDEENAPPSTWQHVKNWQASGRFAGCLVTRLGVTRASTVIKDEQSLLAFYRDIPGNVNCSEAEYIVHAARAFPRLLFKANIASEFRRFSERYVKMRPKVTKALSVLNDRLAQIRNECLDQDCIARRLKIEIGYDVSPESPNTRHNASAMRERNAKFNNETICCEWHVKFHPTHNRLHFHFGKPEIDNGKVLICHFVDHFST
ncbi:MAG: hypothetical protein HQL94_10235 [Magnetococcales bacterium]|nr:hypothetical protein [Magnetococcales bacterium]MBF0438725.1 hypothetical protein [Magnetococcales bacterium]